MAFERVGLDRERIGKGYYALRVGSATPSKAVTDLVTKAVREAFAIPAEQVRVVSAQEARERAAAQKTLLSR